MDDPLNITVNQTVVAFDHSYVLSLSAASAVNATRGVLTADELQQYVGMFEQGASQSDVQIQIINSPAYSNSPPPPVAATMRMLS